MMKAKIRKCKGWVNGCNKRTNKYSSNESVLGKSVLGGEKK